MFAFMEKLGVYCLFIRNVQHFEGNVYEPGLRGLRGLRGFHGFSCLTYTTTIFVGEDGQK